MAAAASATFVQIIASEGDQLVSVDRGVSLLQKSCRMRKCAAPAKAKPKPMSQNVLTHESKKPGALRFSAGSAISVTAPVLTPRTAKMEKKMAACKGSGSKLTPLGAATIASASCVAGRLIMDIRRKFNLDAT